MGSSSSSVMSFLSFMPVVLLFLLLPSLPPSSADTTDHRGEWILSPNFPPNFNSCQVVECGRGSCRATTDHMMGFVCDCDAGWRQPQAGNYFRFLPCVVPNCTFDLKCSNSSSVAASQLASPLDHQGNNSFFEPCDWAFCGEGSCMNAGRFNLTCECRQGYSNLFNQSTFPCFNECSIQGECSTLGISLSNQSSTSSRPSLSNNGSNIAYSTFHGGSISTTILIISLAVYSFVDI